MRRRELRPGEQTLDTHRRTARDATECVGRAPGAFSLGRAGQDAGSQETAGHAGGGQPGVEQDVMGFILDTCEFAVLAGHPWRYLVGVEI